MWDETYNLEDLSGRLEVCVELKLWGKISVEITLSVILPTSTDSALVRFGAIELKLGV